MSSPILGGKSSEQVKKEQKMSKESYARGFVKAAAAAGVDPTELAKFAQSIVFGGGPTPGGGDFIKSVAAGKQGVKNIKDFAKNFSKINQAATRAAYRPLGDKVITAYDDLPWYKKVLVGLSPDAQNRLRRTPSRTQPFNGGAASRTTVPSSNN